MTLGETVKALSASVAALDAKVSALPTTSATVDTTALAAALQPSFDKVVTDVKAELTVPA